MAWTWDGADAGGTGSARARYDAFRMGAGCKVEGATARTAEAFDATWGDRPWRAAGLDARAAKIARRVMTEVVPKVAGERVASVMDGLAIKGGLLGAGFLLKLPLRVIALPVLAGLATIEAATAVEAVRAHVGTIAAEVDAEDGP